MRVKKPHKSAPELSDAEIKRILVKLGKLTKERRKATHSVEDFAYETGLSRSAMVRYEAGGDLLLSNFLKVIYGLGVSPEKIVDVLK